MMSSMIHDMRHALRMLIKHPGYTTTALFTLAAGIAFNTAIFSVVNAVLLRPLPYPDPDRLVIIRERRLPQFPEFSVAPGSFLTWQAQASSFDAVAAYTATIANLDLGNEVERLRGDRVSASLFRVLGIAPLLGRGFTREEDLVGAPPVIILSHALWQRRFGGDPGIVGKPVRIGTTNPTVVGILPQHITFPTIETEFWVPLSLTQQEQQMFGSHFFSTMARLKPGVSFDQAVSEMAAISSRIATERPEAYQNWEALLFPAHDYIVRDVRRALFILLGAVGFVLLIACVNVANLLLARGAARRKEFAIRAALGAGRGRLIRQLLAENFLLGLAGAAGGVVLGAWLLRALIALAPDRLPRVQEIGFDRDVFIFALVLGFATPIVFGLVPALLGSRTRLTEALGAGGRQGSAAPAARLRTALVVGEIALALMLLVGAGLLVRSFARIQAVPVGFDPARVLTGGLTLPTNDYPDNARREQFTRDLMARLPGADIERAALTQSLPLVSDMVASFEREDAPAPSPSARPRMNFFAVTPGYFETMGIRVVAGRSFTDQDDESSARVVIVNETLARLHFPDRNPIGSRIRVSQGPGDPLAEIVGIVADVKQYGVTVETPAQVYEPLYRHSYFRSLTLVVRSRGSDAAAVTPQVRGTLRQMDRAQTLSRPRTMGEVVEASIGPQRFAMTLLSLFGIAALGLAAVGLYGVIAYTVGQRRQEIAIRVAHGATGRDIVSMVLAGALRTAFIGVALGLAGAFLLRGLIENMLFDTEAADPMTYVVVAILLTTIAVLASAIPAFRATRLDPAVVLRQ